MGSDKFIQTFDFGLGASYRLNWVLLPPIYMLEARPQYLKIYLTVFADRVFEKVIKLK